MNKFLDIIERKEDYQKIYSDTFRAEKGIRAIGLIYHDHSDDKESFDSVFRLKSNIEYRLFSATNQYLIFLKELSEKENYLQQIYKENPHFIRSGTFPMGNVYFDKVEAELSSVFDNIIFNLSSVFDYLSHAICYMYFANKENTLYWTKLSKKVRGDLKGQYEFCKTIDFVDRRFVGKLYDYRSRLLHNKRDKHDFATSIQLNDFEFELLITCSNESLKQFKLIKEHLEFPEQRITLTYLASWLIKRTFIEIENILDSIKIDLENNSKFHYNITNSAKAKTGLMFATINPETHFVEPSSNGIWNEYKYGRKGSS